MKKSIAIMLFILIGTGSAFAEQVSLSTYYPPPFGVYDRLRLIPRVNPIPCTPANEGLIYYLAPSKLLIVCKNPGGATFMGGPWRQNNINAATAEAYLTEMDMPSPRAVNVGIGTITPGANLHLYDASAAPILLLESGVNNDAEIRFNANRSGSGDGLGVIDYNWNGNSVAQIMVFSGTDVGNKDVADIVFRTRDNADAIPQERLRIDQSGNVGIGTNTPSDKLTIDGGSSDVSHRIDINDAAGGSVWLRLTETRFRGGFLRYDNATQNLHIGVHNNNNFNVAQDDVAITIERNSGDVLINGGAYPGGQQVLNVRGSINLKEDLPSCGGSCPWGRLRLQYVAGNYYMTFAP